MIKKTGLFDVEFILTTQELNIAFKGEKRIAARYKSFSEALGTVINQMQVSSYRLRTIKDYKTILMNFEKDSLSRRTYDRYYLLLA